MRLLSRIFFLIMAAFFHLRPGCHPLFWFVIKSSLQLSPTIYNCIDIDFRRVHLGNHGHYPKPAKELKMLAVSCVRLCNFVFWTLLAPGPASVANDLKYPVSFGFFGIIFSIGFPVFGMALCPLFLAKPLSGLVIRISFDFNSLTKGGMIDKIDMYEAAVRACWHDFLYGYCKRILLTIRLQIGIIWSR